MRTIDNVGRIPADSVNYVLDIVGLISVALRASRHVFRKGRRSIFLTLFIRQIYNTGVKALYINGIIAAFIGALMMTRLFNYIPQQVLEEQYGYLFMVIIFRELGPLISGVILIARSATAITAEIGYLRLRREFQVLRGLGINPVFLFLVPIFFAFPISLFLMFIYFNFICMLTAYVFLWFADPSISFSGFVTSILVQITLNEVAVNAVKAILGGMVIGVISIHFGARVKDSFDEVADAISSSTTSQLMAFFLINVALSLLAYTQ